MEETEPPLTKWQNLHKQGLNIKARLRIYLRQAKFGSKGRKPKKERDTYMESFHISYPHFLYLVTKFVVNDFELFAKISIRLRIIIFFEGWPIYAKV